MTSDTGHNEYGTIQLSFCKTKRLRIVNGMQKDGHANEFSFNGTRGLSTIDKLLSRVHICLFIKINLSPVILTLFLTMHHHTELHISMNNHPCQKPADSPENLQCKHSLWKVEHFGPCTESIILNQHRLKDCINIEYISFQTDMDFCISN